MPPTPTPDWLQAARAQWAWRGQQRPPFAVPPGPGQVSVWDFPRPPRLVADAREVVLRWGTLEVARSRRALCVQETGHPPSFYLPWADVAQAHLEPAPGGSFCEWKGPARYWSLVDGARQLPGVAWGYPQPLSGAVCTHSGGAALEAPGMARDSCYAAAACQALLAVHQSALPGPPLNGPTSSGVIQPP